MPVSQFEFSRERLSRMSGSGADEVEYVRWYADTCAKNISAAASTITAIANGEKPFDRDLPALLRVSIGAVRFYLLALQEGQAHFKNKSDLARIFSEADARVAEVVKDSERQAAVVNKLFVIL